MLKNMAKRPVVVDSASDILGATAAEIVEK